MPDPRLTDQQYEALSKWFRLLIGLSTGAVIAIATFLRDLFSVPVAGWLLLRGIGFFAISTLFSVFFLAALTSYVYDQALEWPHNWMGKPAVPRIAETSFYIGFVAIVAFIIWNLYGRVGTG